MWRDQDGTITDWLGRANGALLSPTEKVWEDAVAGAQQLLNQITIDTMQKDIEAQMIKDHSGGVPIPNASAGDLSAEMSAAIGDMWYVDNPSAQSGAPKSTFVDVITMASDPNFLVTYDEGTHIAMDLSNYSDAMDLIDSSTNTFDLNINGTDVISQWHDGAPPADSSSVSPSTTVADAIIVTGVKPSFTDPNVYVPSGYMDITPAKSSNDFTDGYGGAGAPTPAAPPPTYTTMDAAVAALHKQIDSFKDVNKKEHFAIVYKDDKGYHTSPVFVGTSEQGRLVPVFNWMSANNVPFSEVVDLYHNHDAYEYGDTTKSALLNRYASLDDWHSAADYFVKMGANSSTFALTIEDTAHVARDFYYSGESSYVAMLNDDPDYTQMVQGTYLPPAAPNE